MRKALMTALLMDRVTRFAESSKDAVQIQASLLYIKSIKRLRQVFMNILGMAFCMALFTAGLVIFHISILANEAWTLSARVQITMICAGMYILFSVGVFCFLFSQRNWMHFFNANEMLEKALE